MQPPRPRQRPPGPPPLPPRAPSEPEIVELEPEPESPPPEAQRRPSVERDASMDTWPVERPTVARRRRIEERAGDVSYPDPTPSLRSSIEGLKAWGRRYWWVLVISGATGGSFTLSRLWELLGVATKADLERTRTELYAALDGGAHDTEARKALDGGAHDHIAREAVEDGINAAAADARAARAAAANARRLVGLDPDAGLTVTKENDPH